MNFSGLTVLCIGDVMLDRYLYGRTERISPEAPVPVVHLVSTREMLGGAGNVANNIAAFGGHTILTGVVGRDANGRSLRAALADTHGVTDNLLDLPNRPTICKTRLIAANQQVVRLDEESRSPLSASESGELLRSAVGWFDRTDIIILSDYGKGLVSADFAAELISTARMSGIPVFVDPKHDDFGRYRGATCIKPNLKELAAASRRSVDSRDEVIAAARLVMDQAGAGAILATRSEHGMMLIEPDRVHSVEARAREVFDVSGAGDTAIALMALCYASGLSLAESLPFANAAASVVVSKLGTATVTIPEVIAELSREQPVTVEHANSPMPLEDVQALVAMWKRQGLSVGFANGCFDILHYGHIALFAFAHANCDRLVVALNSDSSVRALKGATRPMNTLELRSKVIAALRNVDCVVSFEEETPIDLIRILLPDVLIKGEDYRADQVVGGDIVRAAGGRVALAPLIDGQSSTRLHTLLAAE